MRMPRPLYIAYRVAEMLVSVLSRLLNAILGGSTHQTTSARAHIEPQWRVARRIINALFFWQADHCLWAWEQEVASARKTLARAREI